MENIFKRYRSALDKEFVRYIAQKKDFFENEGEMSEEHLIQFALNKYTILSKQDTWNVKTQEEEQIVALTAELRDTNLKLASAIKNGGIQAKGKSKGGSKPNKTKRKRRIQARTMGNTLGRRSRQQTERLKQRQWDNKPTTGASITRRGY